ncbi:MAG: sigma-70 family RNA polymerase sigma factor [Pedosphaera sp.]|nr:sigma-70 family RNA polymerase sigma factor [Pedosphaera sp.]
MCEQPPFEQFMGKYQNMVFTTAWRMLANEAEAQDISQEVFLKAHEHFIQLAESPTAGGWLRTVTRNLCLNHLTRYRRRWLFFSEMFQTGSGESEQDFNETLEAENSVETEIITADHRRVIEGALAKLPTRQRLVLVLYHFEEKSYVEIAELTKTSLANVKTDIFRGRMALRKKLGPSLEMEMGWPSVAAPAVDVERSITSDELRMLKLNRATI